MLTTWMMPTLLLATSSAAQFRHAIPTAQARTSCASVRMAAEPPQPADDASAPPALSALSRLAETQDDVAAAAATPGVPSAACAVTQTPDERRRSLILGVAAPMAATALYAYQRANPVNPIKLLAALEARSPELPTALASGTPTLLEFYAPWCVSCRDGAPTMLRLEKRFSGKVNFVVCNAEDPQYAQLVRLFGVDGIPHLAFIDSERKLRSTLVGEVPEKIVEQSVDALASGRPLPYDAMTDGVAAT